MIVSSIDVFQTNVFFNYWLIFYLVTLWPPTVVMEGGLVGI